MAYDEDLADRIRELVSGEPDVTEVRMFGGLAFVIGGNMSVAASGQGGLMVRVDPGHTDALVIKPHVQPFEMRGRAMQGWLRVDTEGLRTKRQLDGSGAASPTPARCLRSDKPSARGFPRASDERADGRPSLPLIARIAQARLFMAPQVVPGTRAYAECPSRPGAWCC